MVSPLPITEEMFVSEKEKWLEVILSLSLDTKA